jgi:hypothetical protein
LRCGKAMNQAMVDLCNEMEGELSAELARR